MLKTKGMRISGFECCTRLQTYLHVLALTSLKIRMNNCFTWSQFKPALQWVNGFTDCKSRLDVTVQVIPTWIEIRGYGMGVGGRLGNSRLIRMVKICLDKGTIQFGIWVTKNDFHSPSTLFAESMQYTANSFTLSPRSNSLSDFLVSRVSMFIRSHSWKQTRI